MYHVCSVPQEARDTVLSECELLKPWLNQDKLSLTLELTGSY
jgi:hypothetical protein